MESYVDTLKQERQRILEKSQDDITLADQRIIEKLQKELEEKQKRIKNTAEYNKSVYDKLLSDLQKARDITADLKSRHD